jgi:hypothetical protein
MERLLATAGRSTIAAMDFFTVPTITFMTKKQQSAL